MRHGSLFSGIGGFDLAAEWMGWKNIFHCEWNPFGQKVLKHYWPNAESFTDITKTDFTKYNGSIDIISGGFPCQPYSAAGKRKGKEDERHLWPEMLRTIREVQPVWVVGENVLGLVNWSNGLVFHEVQTDLETEGYEVFPYVLPACAKDAPHRRDRVWFIAYSESNIFKHAIRNEGHEPQKVQEKRSNELISIANAKRIGQSGSGWPKRQVRTAPDGNWKASWLDADGGWPTQSPVRSGNDGLPADMDTSAFSKSKWNEESLKAAGNAIVPQIAYEIFKAIESFDLSKTPE